VAEPTAPIGKKGCPTLVALAFERQGGDWNTSPCRRKRGAINTPATGTDCAEAKTIVVSHIDSYI
jgi:hypothetical protein